MHEHPSKQTPLQTSRLELEDVRDCLQCLILLYGETHIDTLAQLLHLTSYAESRFLHLYTRRLR
jgi:hypothetical protein